MPLTGKIKEVVADKTKTAEDIERQALAENMATLRVSTRNKVLAGITSMEEFKRIAYSNEDSDDATAAAAE
jgi:type IV pilus assembly protein PilB